jgi:hypothetical protein
MQRVGRLAGCVIAAVGVMWSIALRAQTAAPSPPAAPAPAPAASRAPAPSPAAVERAGAILAEARKALGGDALAAVKTVVATGRTRRVRGNNLQPIEFEMSIELPDKYVRTDEFPAEATDPTTTGFNGERLIARPERAAGPAPAARRGAAPPGAAAGAAAPDPQHARLVALKQDFVRFALGFLPGSFDTYPLTFAYAAEARAPQGTADVLDVTGAEGFAARLFIDQATHLPLMVSWRLPPSSVMVTVPGAPPPATVAPGAVMVMGPPPPADGASQADKDAYAKAVGELRDRTQKTPVEHRLYFADYRPEDHVKFPFRLRRAIGVDTTEETTFDGFRINTRIDPRKFDVSD